MKLFTQQILSLWLALFAALVTMPTQATPSNMSDIDIYTTGATGAAPNVLIIMDNTSNWSSAFTTERAAVVNALTALPATSPVSVRVGLMLFTETTASGGGMNGQMGGYVRSAIRDLTADYKTKLGNVLAGLDSNSDQSSSQAPAGLTMAEAYYYFAGKPPYSGWGKVKTDYDGNTSGTSADQALYALGQNALEFNNGSGNYRKPVADNCSGNYIIYISNGKIADPTPLANEAATRLTNAYADVAPGSTWSSIPLTPSSTTSSTWYADEWARFMKQTAPEAITTYTVDVNPGSAPQDLQWTAVLKSMSAQSGGLYSSVSTSGGSANLEGILGNVFNQILAKNAVFSSASLPVSVNARGSYLNQVFMGMFRPDKDALPRWRGNLKQYKFSYDVATDSISLVDSVGNQAISGATGFVATNAISYWTKPSTFFTNEPQGTPPSASDSPDGEVVEKGGVAEQLRIKYATNQSARRVFTCVDCSPGGAAAPVDLTVATTTLFSTTNTTKITESLLTPTGMTTISSTERDQIVNWARGNQNTPNGTGDFGPGGATTVRASIHGDVLHSRPAVVNYGAADGNPTNVVVFYGANDGLLRAINGNQNDPLNASVGTYGGVAPGEEFWSFLPVEHFKKLKRLRDNSPEVKLATTSISGPTPRDYTMDGPIGLYQKVISVNGVSSVSKAYIYAGMRRGGRALYAFDVTTVNTPKLMWKVTPTQIPRLGQTWSEPRVARLRGIKDGSGNDVPVIIMGGGYDDAAEDSFTPGTTSMGDRIYVLNALTGAVIKEFTTNRSVPSDVTLVDADYDGYVDRAYVSDVGGTVYRIDFEVMKVGVVGQPPALSTAPVDWISNPIASLSTNSIKRKVFFQPDVVLSGGFTSVMVGTGDREKPLCGGILSVATTNCPTTNDGFFMFKDTVGARPLNTLAFTNFVPADMGTLGVDGQDFTNGCVVPMSTAGEKVVNAPLTVGGYTYFNTNTPFSVSNSCNGNLGTAKTYGVKYFCQRAISEVRTGGGLPPSPVAGVVAVPDPNDPTKTKQVPFLIGGIADPNASTGTVGTPANDSNCNLGGCQPKINPSPNRTRKYWFVENPK